MIIKPLREDESIDALDTMYPSRMYAVAEACDRGFGELSSTYYIIFPPGAAGDIECPWGQFTFYQHGVQVMSIPGTWRAFSVDGCFAVIERVGFRGQFAVNAMEMTGRLSYIDGCSDSLLIYPPRLGDPCLNHLHFPQGILQTQHTHPSIRMGVVVSGRGAAWQRSDEYGGGWEEPLEPGTMFMLEQNELHSFKTPSEEMDIIAWHPDSDWGPSDESHPMLNRTYINHGQ